ncbi:hypothetical protein ES705_33174 [subsurface metagenome]
MRSLKEVKKFLEGDWNNVFPSDNIFGWIRESVTDFYPELINQDIKANAPN